MQIGDTQKTVFTFEDNVIFNQKIGIGTTTIPHGGLGAAKIAIEGTDSSASAGPIAQFTTNTDDYSLLQVLPWSHDNVALVFDAAFDGTNWKSSDAGSNLLLHKNADLFIIYRASGVSQGSNITWTNALTLKLTDGKFGFNNGSPSTLLHGLTSTAADGLIIGDAFIGNWNGGSSYMAVCNTALRATTNSYALIQHTTGSTQINAASGQTLFFLINNSTGMVLDPNLNVGIGTSSPQAKLHVYDTIAGFIANWKYDGLDGTSRTIIPDGTGDVLYGCRISVVLRDSAGNFTGGVNNIANGASAGIVVGANTVTFAVSAAGALTVSRTAGTDTIKVNTSVIWL